MGSRGKVSVVLDANAGSCGKGKFMGYLALRDHPGVAINNFMSNAGHTFVADNGYKVMTQHLPTSLVNSDMELCIGPGAAITPSILIDEIRKYKDLIGDRQIMIHPRAMIILREHCNKEKEILKSGSTFKGCGAAQADKLMRVPGIMLAYQWINSSCLVCGADIPPDHRCGTQLHAEIRELVDRYIKIRNTGHVVNNAIDQGIDVMVEGSQGFDLDINYGLEYPHTTSRQCHAGQLVADCGISPRLVDEIIMIMRPYPIRISNSTNIGVEIYSGTYDGSEEISWDEVKSRCGAPADVEFGEMTTVTKKMRRVFEMNWDRLAYAAKINRPTQIALNFAQYLDWDILNKTDVADITPKIKDFITKVEYATHCPVTMIGTGPNNNHIIDLRINKGLTSRNPHLDT